MKKRTARRLAAATALVVPGAMSAPVVSHAAPKILIPHPNSVVGGRSVTIFAEFSAPRPVTTVKLFLDQLMLAQRSFSPAGVSGNVTFAWDSTASLPGAHHVTLKMYDKSGHVLGVQSIPVSVMNGNTGQDVVPPQVAILTPTANQKLQGTFDVKVLATDDSGQAPYVSLFIDNQLRSVSNRQPYSYTVDSTKYDNGHHTLEAWAYDAANNKSISNAVPFDVNNPGGATTINEDVNRLGEAGATPAATPSPTAAPLPEPATAKPVRPAPATVPVTAPVHHAAKPVAHVPKVARASKPASRLGRPLPNPAAETPAETAPAAVPQPVASDTVPAEKAPKTLLAEAPRPVETPTSETTAAPKPIEAPASRLAAPVSAPAPAPAAPVAPVSSSSEPAPVPTAPVDNSSSIQELPVEEAPAPDATAAQTPAPIEEMPAPQPATVAPPVEPDHPVMVAEAPKTVEAPKPSEDDGNGQPMVLKMQGDKVIEASPRYWKTETPASKPAKAPKPAASPKKPAASVTVLPAQPAIKDHPVADEAKLHRERVAKADRPRAVSHANIVAPTPKPEPAGTPKLAHPPVVAENPAPRPQRVAELPHPTAPVVHRPKQATVARAMAKTHAHEDHLKPVAVRELPADYVRNGRIHHAARPGETPAGVARNYGVPVKRLVAENRIGRNGAFRVGEVIAVPSPVRIAFNDQPIQFDVAPRIEEGVTIAAIRQIYEQAGGQVTWDKRTREIHATGAGADIVLRVGSRTAVVNGHAIRLDAPVALQQGRTMVPVRFLTESLKLEAEYDLRSGEISLHKA